MSSISDPRILSQPVAPRPLHLVPLTAAALALAWLGIAAAGLDHWSRFALGGSATVLALLVFRRERMLAQRRQQELERTVARAAAHNDELELMRGIAHTLLAFEAPQQLFEEVARVAKELLRAEGGAVFLRSDVSEFLRVVAASGVLEPARGRLLPLEGSLAGWVVTHDESLRSDDMAADPRNHPVDAMPRTLRSAIHTPLRSKGVVIGVAAAYNRRDGEAFTAEDDQLLQALGDQVAVGLDRAALLEEARRKELALQDTNRELVEATRLKSQFLANMSHELRTPLNAIIGFSDLILVDGDTLDETQRDYIESIARNGRHLLGLINSVLDVAKLEAGRMTSRLAQFDLRRAVAAAVSDTESLRTIKRQTCTVEISDGPLEILADQQQVRQVLFNLLSNASKFTEEGGAITLTVAPTRVPLAIPAERAGESSTLGLRDAAWVAVKDTGVGIPEDGLSKLFQAFSQVDASTSRTQQGTGLGLVLAKQLVELHGGTMGVESAVGKGSTFWFILPIDGPVRRPDARA